MTSCGRHKRPACYQAPLSTYWLKNWFFMVKLCVHVFFTPWGHVNFMPIFGTHLRHLGHMTHMLDSDWLKKFLLRSDWLPTEVAMYTTCGMTISMQEFKFLCHCSKSLFCPTQTLRLKCYTSNLAFCCHQVSVIFTASDHHYLFSSSFKCVHIS